MPWPEVSRIRRHLLRFTLAQARADGFDQRVLERLASLIRRAARTSPLTTARSHYRASNEAGQPKRLGA